MTKEINKLMPLHRQGLIKFFIMAVRRFDFFLIMYYLRIKVLSTHGSVCPYQTGVGVGLILVVQYYFYWSRCVIVHSSIQKINTLACSATELLHRLIIRWSFSPVVTHSTVPRDQQCGTVESIEG